jgi:ABC-type uncharacterized transport system permease subunit/ABC-type uncharacterized transport system substrate-binding protein
VVYGQKTITVGFVQAIEDATIDQARKGYFDALAEEGYSEKKGNLSIIYRNAQGSIANLNTIQEYFVQKPVDIIAANTTLATISAINKTPNIPVFMMVSPEPALMQLNTVPKNLSGTYETLAYIDTAVTLISQLLPKAKRVGTVYNASEPNATNALTKLERQCKNLNLTLITKPVTQSSETQIVVQSLIAEGIDVFFALPDNIIFSSFETVYQACENKNIPIFSSETGLVSRGASVAFGADMYAWGYQSGKMTAFYLKNGILLAPTIVQKRTRVYHPVLANKYSITKNHLVHTNTNPKQPSQSFVLTTLLLGMLLSILGLGIFISFKVFKIPDITADGSYTLGASITALCLSLHIPIVLTLFFVFLAGGLTGFCSAIIHTKGKVNPLLAGILVMTALYSVNLGIMGRSNVPLLEYATLFKTNIPAWIIIFLFLSFFVLFWLYLFQTDLGIVMRATGYNETMLSSIAVSANRLKLFGLALSNSIIALAGSLVAQYQGFADINMGIGIMLSGLAGIILGETFEYLFQTKKTGYSILFSVLGCMIFQGMMSFSLTIGISPNWLKLVSAVFVLIAVVLPVVKRKQRAS